MFESYEEIIKSVVKACVSKDQVALADAQSNLTKLRIKPETSGLAHTMELILEGARVQNRLIVMVKHPEHIATIKEILKQIYDTTMKQEGVKLPDDESESHLGIVIVNGTRKFDIEERGRIKKILTNTPRFHLARLKMIRAEISSENWLGRYQSKQGLIQLNNGWTNSTLIHEIGHGLFDTLPNNQQDEWLSLNAKTKNAYDFVDYDDKKEHE